MDERTKKERERERLMRKGNRKGVMSWDLVEFLNRVGRDEFSGPFLNAICKLPPFTGSDRL